MPTRPCILACLFLIFACGSGEEPKSEVPKAGPIWEEGAAFVARQMTARYLKHEDPVYLQMDIEHTPSTWVEYFFSVYSTRNWLNKEEAADYGVRNALIMPDVRLSNSEYNTDLKGRQLVVFADDEQGLVMLEGWADDDDEEPVFTRSLPFPKLQ